MTYQTAAAEALAEWRNAEARLNEADPQGPEWQDVYLEVQRAKARYHDAVDAVSSTNRSSSRLKVGAD